jgi:hypothetical protein
VLDFCRGVRRAHAGQSKGDASCNRTGETP